MREFSCERSAAAFIPSDKENNAALILIHILSLSFFFVQLRSMIVIRSDKKVLSNKKSFGMARKLIILVKYECRFSVRNAHFFPTHYTQSELILKRQLDYSF